eukprot:scaffold157401_cov28-Tisochrysis_lutea.AAC.5
MARRRAVPSGPIGEVGLRDMREERERKERKSEQHGRIRLLGQWHWRAWNGRTGHTGVLQGFHPGFYRGLTPRLPSVVGPDAAIMQGKKSKDKRVRFGANA